MILFGTNDIIRLVTSTAATLDVVALHATLSGGITTKGRQQTKINSATTTTVVDAPGSGNERTVYALTIRNTHASLSSQVTVQLFDGTNAFALYRVTLGPGEQLIYDGIANWRYLDAQGLPRQNQSQGVLAPLIGVRNAVVLASDVVNNNGVANTIQDITGLSFPVVAGGRFWFRFTLDFSSAATTTGARFSINGPAFSRLSYSSNYSLTGTSETVNQGLGAYDLPAAANANVAATGQNIATVEGFITPSADGNVIGRFASEVASSAITVRAGSLLEWVQVS